MANTMEMARMTIKDLKENHPDYYGSLYPECKVCKNIMSSSECDMCEDFDMFVKVEED